MSTPEISVVMSAYNEADQLDQTIQSILNQQGVDFELIIVNDGSIDETEAIVRDNIANDSRIVLINQVNRGLTRALIAGCQRATGQYIARQDAGDISKAGRLKAQYDVLRANSSIAMCSTGTVFIAPDGEEFNHTILAPSLAASGLKQSDVKTLIGPPHHGSVMFRRDIYQQVGGYRAEFDVAQDLDLWTRMVECGEHTCLQKIYYKAGVQLHSISSVKRTQQIKATQTILECCRARANLGTDSDVVSSIRTTALDLKEDGRNLGRLEFDFYYFIGACLAKTQSKSSRKYLIKAIKASPLNVKAYLRLLF